MPDFQTLATILFMILGFCAFLALGAFIGKLVTPAKLVTFAGVVALISVILYSVYSANYFISM